MSEKKRQKKAGRNVDKKNQARRAKEASPPKPKKSKPGGPTVRSRQG